MNIVAEEILMHYGMPRRSGRYPWGSGENPYQHSGDFLSRVEELKKNGLSETEIAKEIGLTTTQLRVQKSLARDERRTLDVDTAKGLRKKGYSTNKIAEKMGIAESTVRSLLNSSSEERMNQSKYFAEIIKKEIDKKGMVDVGVGVERELGISKEKLNQALYILEREGYEIYGGSVPQATNPGQKTNIKIACPPGTEHKDIYNYANISSLRNYTSRDGGKTFDPYVYPKSMSSDRLKIRYAEEGGLEKDGLVEIRRGVKDLSLGDSHYAQVRILVDDNKYIKGMAVYSDGKDMPDGVDIIFNTNKKTGTPKLDVLKNIKDDPDNPFGALIKANGQSYYNDDDGSKQLSLINKTREEGDWTTWSDRLPAQFLSKQNKTLVKKQLDLSVADKQAEFDEICSLTNPTVKKILLNKFAEDCDSTAVHLNAASMPRQKYQVIIPITSMGDREVYAPNYVNGEKVALIRYPHGGTFEIPILTVNNKNAEAHKMLGTAALDVVGINSKVAERLSGADFDGDAVMVIPTNTKVKITSTPALEGLKGFDPKIEYGPDSYAGRNVKLILNNNTSGVSATTQNEMGRISNLITDMTLKGATEDELAKAVKHSMVIIDAEKHKLDYKKSEIDNDIAYLKKKYQGRYDENGKYHEGASTIISRAKSETEVIKRRGNPIIDKETGKISWKESYEEYTDPKTGKTKVRTQPSTQMMETDDAYTLVSDYRAPNEILYAEYANAMKAMANQARKTSVNTGKVAYSANAKQTYQEEVASLSGKLNVALLNAPKERQAQIMANATIKAKKQANPDMTKEEKKKISQQALSSARSQVGADSKGVKINITDREWEAIQAGAISETKLKQILDNTNIDAIRERALPKTQVKLSEAKINKITHMANSGYTIAEIAESLGVSTSTVRNYLK